MKKIYVIAGEASGDLHGANLIRHLQTNAKEPVQIYGIGGEKIRETGAWGFFDLAHFHVTGFTDAIKKIPEYRRAGKQILEMVKNIRPELVVLIDNPGFNLYLAEKIHAMGIKIVYYITPQLWAWAPERINKIKKFVSKVLVVFEFEKDLYQRNSIPVTWVGHPLKDIVQTSGEVHGLKEKIGIGKDGHLVLLLPGSRKGEVDRLLPILLKAAQKIADRSPKTYFALLKSPTLPRDMYKHFMKDAGLKIDVVEKNPYEVMRASDLAIVCSGTATLECALVGTPMIITNKGSFITYVAARVLCRVPYIGLPNIVLGQRKFPELLQYEATPDKIADCAFTILTDKATQDRMREDLKEVSRRLGEEGATRRAAVEILKLLSETREQAGTFQVRS